jgi:hypothetical protein
MTANTEGEHHRSEGTGLLIFRELFDFVKTDTQELHLGELRRRRDERGHDRAHGRTDLEQLKIRNMKIC